MRPNRIETVVLAIIAVVLVIGAVISRSHPVFFEERYTVEDGVIEWLTVVALFVAGLVMLRRSLRLTDRSWFPFRLVCIGAALVMFFGAGEEISWGQRLFDLETPELLKEHNRQSEMNLHNLEFGDFSVNKVIFSKLLAVCIVSYVLIMPFLYRRKAGLAALIDRLAIPVPRSIHTVAWLVLITCTEGGVIASKKSGELTEFGGSLLFLLIFLFPLNAAVFARAREVPGVREEAEQ
jgi:hypothetical protein